MIRNSFKEMMIDPWSQRVDDSPRTVSFGRVVDYRNDICRLAADSPCYLKGRLKGLTLNLEGVAVDDVKRAMCKTEGGS